MRILERGIPPSERLWKGTCRHCLSRVEATRAEMKHIQKDTDPRDPGEFSWEVCPVCQGQMCFYPTKDVIQS